MLSKHVPAIALAASLLAFPLTTAAANEVTTVTASDPFEDVAQQVEDAIINRGFAIDYHGFIGDMLKRTAADVGAKKKLYNDAEFFTFCSAVVSRDVMEADAADIAFCPYVVFVYEEAASC